jgi:hypothetical protein
VFFLRPAAICLSVIALGASESKAATLFYGTTIDDFAAGGQSVDRDFESVTSSDPPLTDASVVTDGSIMGGERELFLQVFENPGLQAGAQVLPSVLSGILNVNSGTGVRLSTSVTWDGSTANPLNVDLTDSGLNDLLVLDIVGVDQFADAEFVVSDTSNNSSTMIQTGLGAGPQIFAFSDFSGTADFSQVGSIDLRLSGPEGLDLSVGSVKTARVPVPTVSICLVSIACFVMVGHLRRPRARG